MNTPTPDECLRVGKAAEYLVVSDLLLQGYDAFLSDQGLPFDIIVIKDGVPKTIQVKATTQRVNYQHSRDVYRFGMRTGKKSKGHPNDTPCDYYAFVMLDKKCIGYVKAENILTRHGKIKQTVDIRHPDHPPPKRPRRGGKRLYDVDQIRMLP